MKSTIPKDLEPMDNAEDVWTTFLIMTCLNIKHKDLYSDYLQNYVNAQSYLAKEEFDEDDYKSVAKVVIEDAEWVREWEKNIYEIDVLPFWFEKIVL